MKKLFKENDLVKFVSIAILLTIVLTWTIKGGSFTGAEFAKSDVSPIGLSELALSPIYAVSFFLQQILFVLIIGAFYGIVSKTSGYKKIVSNCAKFVNGKEIPVVLVISAIIALFTSMTSQTFAAFIFIPFIISILLNAKLSKKVAFATTFGSVIVGIIGATYGTDGLYYFNYYMGQDLTKTVGARFAVLAVAYVLFSIVNILNIKSVKKAKKVDESKEDRFAIEEVSKKKVNIWPMAILMILVLVISVLGYVRWEEQFGIKCFTEFHEWLTGLKVGSYPLISNLLGNVTAFGTWELYSILFVLGLVALLSVIIYRVNIDEVVEGIENGLKQMVKPVFLMILGYSIFVLIYWSPIVPSMVNAIVSSKFNVITSAIAAFVSSVFTADFGYTGYTIGAYLTASYPDSLDKIAVIFPAMHGFAQLVSPTSVILLAGLAYANVSYKEWMKYIWKFIAAVAVGLLIVFFVI